MKESRWAEEIPQRWKQPKGENGTDMKKEEKLLRCTLLSGSAWSTERKYTRRYEGKCDIFFGIEHRLREEEMEEQFNKKAKDGWIFAADARITDERAGSEDQKHTSGGVFVAVDSNLGADVGEKEGAVTSIPGNEGRIAQVWVNVRGGVRMFAAYFWHTEGWISRNEAVLEAVLKRARATKHPWLVACDADMSPVGFEKSLWFRKDRMHVTVPDGVSTCRSKSAKGEWVEKVYDYVIACNRPKGKISQMKVVEDFESRPHKAVSFVVERGKEIQEWNEQKLPKVLPGHSGGRLPGRSTKEKGSEEGEVDEDGEERRIRGQIVQEVVAGIREKVNADVKRMT